MRKGQKQLIEKGVKHNFTENAINLLKNESKSINELKQIYFYLTAFKDCQQDVVDHFSEVQDMMQQLAQTCSEYCYIQNDWERTRELFEFLQTKPECISKCTYWRMVQTMASIKDKNDDYILQWAQIKTLMESLDSHIYMDDEFKNWPNSHASCNTKILFDVISEMDIKNFDEILLILNVFEKSGRILRYYSFSDEHLIYRNFIKRISKYESLGIEKTEMIQYECYFLDSLSDKVYVNVLQKSFPDIKKFLKAINTEKNTYEKELGTYIDKPNTNEICIFNKEKIKPFIKFAKDLTADMTIPKGVIDINVINAWIGMLSMEWHLSLDAISIKFTKYKSLCISRSKKTGIFLKRDSKNIILKEEYLITASGHILHKYRKKWIPVLLRDLSNYDYGHPCTEEYDVIDDSIRNQVLMFFIGQFIKNGRYAWKDIMPYINSNEYWENIPKLSINEVSDAYSLDNAIKKHYKKAAFMNWNKGDIRMGMLIMKSLSKVDDKSKKVLLSMKYMSEQDYINKHKLNRKAEWTIILSLDRISVEDFLAFTILDNLTTITREQVQCNAKASLRKEAFVWIYDYVKMSIDQHKKVSLTFKSFAKVRDAHNELVLNHRLALTPIIRIPQDSRFNDLRKLLPDDMEWITSRKRIVLEGTNMHHCVASYASKINDDKCAIYSFVSKENDKRYTVEYVIRDNKYCIRQIHGKYDSIPPASVIKYARSFIA